MRRIILKKKYMCKRHDDSTNKWNTTKGWAKGPVKFLEIYEFYRNGTYKEILGKKMDTSNYNKNLIQYKKRGRWNFS